MLQMMELQVGLRRAPVMKGSFQENAKLRSLHAVSNVIGNILINRLLLAT